MRVYLKRISTGNKLVFPSMPKESVDVTTQNKYQKFNILNKGEIAQPTGPEVREYKWSGIFFRHVQIIGTVEILDLPTF